MCLSGAAPEAGCCALRSAGGRRLSESQTASTGAFTKTASGIFSAEEEDGRRLRIRKSASLGGDGDKNEGSPRSLEEKGKAFRNMTSTN